jgi:transposase
MIDREKLRREMAEHRENIERRQAELDACHENIMNEERRTLERARAAEPEVIYKTRENALIERGSGTIVPHSEPECVETEPDWVDATAIALAETRAEMRADFEALVEKAQATTRKKIARLEGQLAVLTAILGDKKPAPRRAAKVVDPAKDAASNSKLRLIKPP